MTACPPDLVTGAAAGPVAPFPFKEHPGQDIPFHIEAVSSNENSEIANIGKNTCR
jgi:hypothetical protein